MITLGFLLQRPKKMPVTVGHVRGSTLGQGADARCLDDLR